MAATEGASQGARRRAPRQRAHRVQHLRERGVRRGRRVRAEPHRELRITQMVVRVVVARDQPRPSSVMRRVAGPLSRPTSAPVPTATMRSPRIATASAHGRVESAVNTFPPVRIRSGAPRGSVCPCTLKAASKAQTAVSIDGRIAYRGRWRKWNSDLVQ